MNGALPGLLDDPQWLSSFNGNVSGPDGSVSTQPHIAPLRNPAPSKGYNVLRPLEPVAEHNSSRSVTKLSPSDILSARESKNSHLAISQLVDTTGDGDSPSLHLANDNASLQLPSFVNLSVLEKSPVQSTSSLDNSYPNKRPRLEPEHVSSHDLNRTLPRPAQKNDMHIPSVPMLPAMVTGLHEPPPSAALLPSINADGAPHQAVKSSTKMQVKDILGETPKTPDVRPREPTSPSAEPPSSDPPKPPSLTTVVSNPEVISLTPPTKKEPKQRRVRRRWTDVETQHLIAGVKRHGMGKWKQILMDTDYVFQDRTSIDLKDRFRVFAKDYPELQNLHAAIQQRKSASPDRKTCDSDSKASSAGDHEQDDSSTALLQRHMSLKQRRKRHPWTQEEDSALLQGVTKHGFQWTDIHKDDDLKLGHRRATDLRDRIRNLYPDGYKQAEARPLRSELKRAEKAAAARKDSTSTPTPIPTTMRESTTSPTKPHAPQPPSSTNYNKGPSIADLTTVDYESDRPVQLHRSKTSMSDAAVLANADANGVTLPSLALGSSADTEEWDNTLPPFLGWDDTLAE